MNEFERRVLTPEERTARTVELLDPRSLPEAGFQSYEMFANNATSEKAPFLQGESRNPHLTYPKLETELSSMDRGIVALAGATSKLEALVEHPEDLKAMQDSLGYRAAEMNFVKILAQLNFVAEHGDADASKELADEAREMSETLYGGVERQIVDATLNTVWAKIDGKQLGTKAEQLRDDLDNGFTSAEGFSVGPMQRAENSEARLPKYDESTWWAGEFMRERAGDIDAMIASFWEEKVTEHGEDYQCSPEDIVDAFQRVIDMRDPDGVADVKVQLVEGKTALSWETPLMSILVGSKRAPIKDQDTLFTRGEHEYDHHGQKAVNGLKTRLPVLGTGLYTTSSDYLTFEEGFASVCEAAMDGSSEGFSGGRLNYYLGIAFAADGDDFRSVFEKTWRYNVLGSVKDGEDVTDEMIEKARSSAYTNCVRIFRGTPTDLKEKTGVDVSVTFNKDLAYLSGSIKAMKLITVAHELNKPEILEYCMKGKFDPTNKEQLAIAERVFGPSGLPEGIDFDEIPLVP